jgi:hypothetical protein
MIFLLFVYEFFTATGRFTHLVHGAGAYVGVLSRILF